MDIKRICYDKYRRSWLEDLGLGEEARLPSFEEFCEDDFLDEDYWEVMLHGDEFVAYVKEITKIILDKEE